MFIHAAVQLDVISNAEINFNSTISLFGTKGENKERFIKGKVKRYIEKFVKRTKGKQGRRVIKKQPAQHKNYQSFERYICFTRD